MNFWFFPDTLLFPFEHFEFHISYGGAFNVSPRNFRKTLKRNYSISWLKRLRYSAYHISLPPYLNIILFPVSLMSLPSLFLSILKINFILPYCNFRNRAVKEKARGKEKENRRKEKKNHEFTEKGESFRL